jgi:hypothetical protein
MDEQPKIQSSQLSRRSLLRSAAVAAGGAAIIGTAMTQPAAAKAPQKAVGYQDTPHGAQECDNCAQFVPPSSCKTVDGDISPTGWCKVYVKKAGS